MCLFTIYHTNVFLKSLIIFFLFAVLDLYSQTITNIKVDQIEDTLLIRYDIIGGREYDLYKIRLGISEDGGRNFGIIPSQAIGDLGYGISRGLKKNIRWEPLKENLELNGDNFIVQIFGEILGTDEEVKFLQIDGGDFEMGDLFEDGATDEMVKRLIRLNSFEISEFEITNKQFAKFLNEYGSDEVKSGEFKGELMILTMEMGLKYYQGEWKPDAGFEFHPAIGISWFGANEFCSYYDFALPSEAEWEFVARERGLKVRYGNGKLIADANEINFNASIVDIEHDFILFGDYRGMSINVGGFSPNQLGIFQMSGNVWEWCQDWYASDYYIKGESENPPGPSFGKYKVIRGGAWSSSGFGIRVSDRSFMLPYSFSDDIGFRVVRRYIKK